MRQKLIVIVLDNRGFGCIDRLQRACGGASFNNLLAADEPWVDFAGHARGAGRARRSRWTASPALEAALGRGAAARTRTTVIVIATDPRRGTEAGGAWWDVAVPEVSPRPEVAAARAAYERALAAREARA